MSVSADTILTAVRDQIPDPVYSVSGNALPNTDGNLFRVTTLITWIDEAVKVTAQKCGWLIADWTATNATTNQPFYSLDAKWQSIEQVWFKEYRLSQYDEGFFVGPYQLRGSRPNWWAYHRSTDHVEISLLPIPDYSAGDPTTTVNSFMGTATPGLLTLGSTTSFNSYGFIQIASTNAANAEIIQYQTVSGNTQITGLTRGVCGTTATSHVAGETVTHLGLWLKGLRVPNPIQTATGNNSTVELPNAFIYPVQLYVLSKVRQSEQEFQEARGLMADYDKAVEAINADPQWKVNQGCQVEAYGSPAYGSLAFGRLIVT